MSSVSVFTGHQQTEQPQTLYNATAVVMVAGALTVECEVAENDYKFSAHHRFEPGKWTRYEVYT